MLIRFLQINFYKTDIFICLIKLTNFMSLFIFFKSSSFKSHTWRVKLIKSSIIVELEKLIPRSRVRKMERLKLNSEYGVRKFERSQIFEPFRSSKIKKLSATEKLRESKSRIWEVEFKKLRVYQSSHWNRFRVVESLKLNPKN